MILLDHQAAHIYTYMGQNILMILRVFEPKKVIYVTKAKIMILDHQYNNIYRYMGQNIFQILGVFEPKNIFYATKAKIVGLEKKFRLLRMNEI